MLELVLAGRWSDIPAATWPPLVWFAAPAGVVTALALLAASTKRPRTLVVVLAVSAFVNLWLPLALAPLLLATRPWPPMESWRTTLGVSAALAFWAFVATPPCDGAVDGFALAPPAGMPATVFASVGIAGAALLAADAAFSDRSRLVQAACLATALMTAAIALTIGGADRTALLGLLVALAWSRVFAGARHVLRWQTSATGRAGAVLLVMLVPALALAKAARPGFHDTDPGTREVWRALDAAHTPAAVVSTGARADIATEVWRAGSSTTHRSLVLLPLVREVVATNMGDRQINAWAAQGEILSTQGFLVAPGVAPEGDSAPLSRLLDYTACRALSPEWADVHGLATDGQFAAVMPELAPLRGGLIYLAGPDRLTPQPIAWPPEGLDGFQVAAFDRQVPAEAEGLASAMGRDELDSQRIGDARFVYRVRFDRLTTAGETLRIGIGGRAASAWVRLYARDDARPWRRPSICLSRAGFAVVGYPDGPARVPLDLSAPQAIGRGWHAFEGVDQSGFRWTAASQADLFFIVHEPQPMTLHLDASPGNGDWVSGHTRVTLNGVDARCGAPTMPCEWTLPLHAMQRGLNTITLQSTPVPAPAPDPRQLGLLVHAVSLSTQGRARQPQ